MKNAIIAIILSLLMAVPLVAAFDGKVSNEADLSLKEAENAHDKIPASFAEAEAKIMPIRNRYLLWDRDGQHIMWGIYGRGFFTGRDNLGKTAWGIYGKSVFAGIYDGRFFYGKYRRGKWEAHGLFHLRSARGRYVLFPRVLPVAVAEPLPK